MSEEGRVGCSHVCEYISCPRRWWSMSSASSLQEGVRYCVLQPGIGEVRVWQQHPDINQWLGRLGRVAQ